MKTSLETWAFTFLAFGIVTPMTLSAFSYIRNEKINIEKSQLLGCKKAAKSFNRSPKLCDNIIK